MSNNNNNYDSAQATMLDSEAEAQQLAEADFDNLRLLEALLFASPRLLTLTEIEPFFAANTPIEKLLSRLDDVYKNRGVQLVKRGQAWGFRTAPDLADQLQITEQINKPLSKAATETMAIIAYHQPVTRAEIEQIRGVNISKSTLDVLLKENFIKPGRRRDMPGRPGTWVTTPYFLDHFGLKNLKDLPQLKELKADGLLSLDPSEEALEKAQEELPLDPEIAEESET